MASMEVWDDVRHGLLRRWSLPSQYPGPSEPNSRHSSSASHENSTRSINILPDPNSELPSLDQKANLMKCFTNQLPSPKTKLRRGFSLPHSRQLCSPSHYQSYHRTYQAAMSAYRAERSNSASPVDRHKLFRVIEPYISGSVFTGLDLATDNQGTLIPDFVADTINTNPHSAGNEIEMASILPQVTNDSACTSSSGLVEHDLFDNKSDGIEDRIGSNVNESAIHSDNHAPGNSLLFVRREHAHPACLQRFNSQPQLKRYC
jgi:hypothetical protein